MHYSQYRGRLRREAPLPPTTPDVETTPFFFFFHVLLIVVFGDNRLTTRFVQDKHL